MACIQKKLLDTRPDLNVQLFLARLITHRPKVSRTQYFVYGLHLLTWQLADPLLHRCILSSGVPAICQVLVAVPDKPGTEEHGACCGHAVLRGGRCGDSPLLGINCHTSGLNLVPREGRTYTNECHRYSGRLVGLS